MSDAPSSIALRDHAVDELDDGGVAGRLADLGDLAGGEALLLVLLDRLGDRGVELGRVRDGGVDVLGGCDRGPHVEAGHDRDVVDRADVRRVRHRDQQRLVADEGDRDRAVAPGRLARNQVHRAEIDLERVQVEVVEPEPLGRRAGELVARDHLRLEQHLLGSQTAGAGFRDRLVDLLLRRVAELDDVIGDETAGATAAARRCEAGAIAAGAAPGGPHGGRARRSLILRTRPAVPAPAGDLTRVRDRRSPARLPSAPLTTGGFPCPSASGPSGTGLNMGWVSVLSVCCATSHSPERRMHPSPKTEAHRSLVNQDVNSVSAAQAACMSCTHQRGAVLTVDEIHHD